MSNNQNKRKKPGLSIPLLVLVLLILFAVYQFGGMNLVPIDAFVSGTRSSAYFTPTNVRVSYDSNSQPYFYSNGSNNFYFATKDGISYITADGQTRWNHVYSLSQPEVCAVKDIVAVSEIGGRSVYVFNAAGNLYSKDFEYPVIYFSVNRIGYLIVQLKKDTDYETKTYDEHGELIFEYKHQDYNTYPITSDISGDGRIVASNILEVGGLQMNSSVSFTYTYGNSRSAFAARNKENQLINTTRFIENNNFILVSDAQIAAYTLGENNIIRDIATLNLNNKLNWFGFMGERGFAMVLGQGLLNKAADPENLLLIYNQNATEIGRFDFGKPVTYFHAGLDAVVIGSYSNYYAISERGALLWEHIVPEDVKQIIFLSNTDMILIATNNEAVVYKRAKNAIAPKSNEGG